MDDFSGVTRFFYLKGDETNTFKIANSTLELYPKSVAAQIILANAYVRFGQKDKALQLYKNAKKLYPDDRQVSASNLNQYVNEMARTGLLDEALDMLKLFVELYPDEAMFYQSMAEIYLQRGRTYFEKALKADPTYEPARKRLKEIR